MESGGMKVSRVQGLDGRECGSKDVSSSHQHRGHVIFEKVAPHSKRKKKYKRSPLERAFSHSDMFVCLCCGHQMRSRWKCVIKYLLLGQWIPNAGYRVFGAKLASSREVLMAWQRQGQRLRSGRQCSSCWAEREETCRLPTYLVAGSVCFLQPHPPLIVQLDWHGAAAGRVLADPSQELLEFTPQGGVLLAGLWITWVALQLPWGGGGGQSEHREEEGRGYRTASRLDRTIYCTCRPTDAQKRRGAL